MADNKKFLLYALVPALIVGAFSLTPKAYDIITSPRADLSFEFAAGPVLEVEGSFQQIFAIRVWNSGKKTLSSVAAHISMPEPGIKADSLQESSGLEFKRLTESDSITYIVSTLHPDELFTISIMVETVNTPSAPIFSVRSQEVLGRPIVVEADASKFGKIDESLAGAIFAALSVFVMVALVGSRRLSFLSAFTGIGGKQDFLFYISARLSITRVADDIRQSSKVLTYLHMSDLLLEEGLSDRDNAREIAIKGLKCMLLVRTIGDSSLEIVKSNLKTLLGEDFSDDYVLLIRSKSISVTNQLKLRALVEQLIENEPAFLTAPEAEG